MNAQYIEWLERLAIPRFREARDLSEVASKTDPEKEPYKSKYKARDILLDLQSLAKDFVNELNENLLQDDQVEESSKESVLESDNIYCDVKTVAAYIEYEIGIINIETEELTDGEERFITCLKLLQGNELHPDNVSLVIATNNQLGILWSNRGEHKSAYSFLRKGESFYLKYKKQQDRGPRHFKHILEPSDDTTSLQKQKEFENLHTHTLYYLAQVFTRLNRPKRAAKYCHVTLARQMKTCQYEPSDWALNCATLSQYYLCKDNFKLARHCLACSSRVYSEGLEKLELCDNDEEEKERKREKVYKGQADIARCWMKYCLNLLKYSHDVKLRDLSSSDLDNNENADTAADDTEEELSAAEDDTEALEVDSDQHEAGVDVCYGKQLLFETLEVDSIENEISAEKANDFDQAKDLYLNGQKWMTQSKEFYQLDGYVTDHVEILQDYSQLLKYLAYFEQDFDRRCKMHKRRIDCLNPVLMELNPQHFLIITRQLTFEIGEIYGEMADLKRAIIEDDASRLSVESIRKINRLLLQGVKYFESFVSSYKQKEVLPETFDDDAVRGVLLAHFYMARYYGKYLTPDKVSKASNLNKEKAMYEFIVAYCEGHPEMPDVFQEELKVSKEILALFPAKMNQLLDAS